VRYEQKLYTIQYDFNLFKLSTDTEGNNLRDDIPETFENR
jgi:hypothetical protein